MKTIIAGSRTITDLKILNQVLSITPWKITEVVCGCAKGVDTMGRQWAESIHVPVKTFPAPWAKYRNSAGPIRNREMVEYAEACIVIWDLKSKGSAHMIQVALEEGLKLFVVGYTNEF